LLRQKIEKYCWYGEGFLTVKEAILVEESTNIRTPLPPLRRNWTKIMFALSQGTIFAGER
jgi:hypothetical protein